jgi:hypothetical protein
LASITQQQWKCIQEAKVNREGIWHCHHKRQTKAPAAVLGAPEKLQQAVYQVIDMLKEKSSTNHSTQ